MNITEALELLESAPQSETKKAAINKVMSQKQAVEIVRKGLLSKKPNDELDSLYTKRVWQVVKNQKRPGVKPVRQKNNEISKSIDNTQPVICEKCGNDMSVDKREGGCVANYCPWCNTRKPKTI